MSKSVAIVTGASQGIGRPTAIRLARRALDDRFRASAWTAAR
jgi:NAD(P)-dependent dehydrogenase (short-subunit alcohol dehydrogenase family)